ncbi:hypothetical protein WA026_013459 [Henosepilachna vigintioctopunctata]|uniref:ATP-dependent RNA helicase n=1 Tax=Henosepilachna vigintioctopunctata TaxID=420089 RepID=A0AAW1VDH3_9CUCU
MKHTAGFDLRELEFLVIDEADRVLDNIQHDWLYHLENHLKQEDPVQHTAKVLNLFSLQKKRHPQKLLFSATLSQDPEKLQKLSLFQPKLFTSIVAENENLAETKISETFVGKYTTPNELTEQYIVCSLDIKPLILYKYIKMQNLTRTMVFTNSVSDAHRLCILLRKLFDNKLRIEELNSILDMKKRKQFIADFLKGTISIIICTDALARGIDIPDVQCVISYSSPKHLKTYIHRAGRTARAGSLGTAVTLLHDSQLGHFKGLLKQAEKNNVEEVVVPTEDLKPLAKRYEQALKQLKKSVLLKEEEDYNNIRRTKRAIQ